MGKDHGKVNWTELWTPDGRAAQKFYAGLFGWVFESMPGSEGSYLLAKKNRKTICGIFEWNDPQSNRWFTHFTVDDVDKSVAGALAAGGAIIKPAFDIPGVGRVAIITDAAGASVGLIAPS